VTSLVFIEQQEDCSTEMVLRRRSCAGISACAVAWSILALYEGVVCASYGVGSKILTVECFPVAETTLMTDLIIILNF